MIDACQHCGNPLGPEPDMPNVMMWHRSLCAECALEFFLADLHDDEGDEDDIEYEDDE